jgi:hypothetical protein
VARGLGIDACPLSLRLWATAPTCRGERLRRKPPQDESQAAELLWLLHPALAKPVGGLERLDRNLQRVTR